MELDQVVSLPNFPFLLLVSPIAAIFLISIGVVLSFDTRVREEGYDLVDALDSMQAGLPRSGASKQATWPNGGLAG